MLTRAVRDALADIAPDPPPRRVQVVDQGEGKWLVQLDGQGLDRFGFTIVPERAPSNAEVAARTAHQLQVGCGSMNDLDPGEYSPRCRIHGHAAQARSVGGVALWCCPEGHTVWSAEIGTLGGIA
jgi:hypothetical protein